ncbi:MAG: hypothetical protein RIE73_17580 [Coleofasciculus sp. C1-SOL-03]|jgi:hypothetical protein|uniref:hypothetical protein n=1 Tax=Coleofasciculus sp. C1-SOL-03 TaxID=3069522 RepID=UPI0032FA0544
MAVEQYRQYIQHLLSERAERAARQSVSLRILVQVTQSRINPLLTHCQKVGLSKKQPD